MAEKTPPTPNSIALLPPLEGGLFTLFDQECRRFHMNLASLKAESTALERDQLFIDMICLSLLVWPTASLKGIEDIRAHLTQGITQLRQADLCGFPQDRALLLIQGQARLDDARRQIETWTGFQDHQSFEDGITTLSRHHFMSDRFPDALTQVQREVQATQNTQQWMRRLAEGTQEVKTQMIQSSIRLAQQKDLLAQQRLDVPSTSSLEEDTRPLISMKSVGPTYRLEVGTYETSPTWKAEDQEHLQRDVSFLRAVEALSTEATSSFSPTRSTDLSSTLEAPMPKAAGFLDFFTAGMAGAPFGGELPMNPIFSPSVYQPRVSEGLPLPVYPPTGIPEVPPSVPLLTYAALQPQEDFHPTFFTNIVQEFIQEVPEIEEWSQELSDLLLATAKDGSPLGSVFKVLDDAYHSKRQFRVLMEAYPDNSVNAILHHLQTQPDLMKWDLVSDTLWPPAYWDQQADTTSSPRECATVAANVFATLSSQVQTITKEQRASLSIKNKAYFINVKLYREHIETNIKYMTQVYMKSEPFQALVTQWDRLFKENKQRVEDDVQQPYPASSIVVRGFLQLLINESHNERKEGGPGALQTWVQKGLECLAQTPDQFIQDSTTTQPPLTELVDLATNASSSVVEPLILGGVANPYGMDPDDHAAFGGTLDTYNLYLASLGTGVMSTTIQYVGALFNRTTSILPSPEEPGTLSMLARMLPIWNLEALLCRLFPTLLGVVFKQMLKRRPRWLLKILSSLPSSGLNINSLTSLLGLVSTAIFAMFSIQSTTQVLLHSGVPQSSLYGLLVYTGTHFLHSVILHPYRIRGTYAYPVYLLDNLLGLFLSGTIQAYDHTLLSPELVQLRKQFFLIISCLLRIGLSHWPSLNISYAQDKIPPMNAHILSFRELVRRYAELEPASTELTSAQEKKGQPFLEVLEPQFPELVKQQNSLAWDLHRDLYKKKGWAHHLVAPVPTLKRLPATLLQPVSFSKPWKDDLDVLVKQLLQQLCP